MNMIQYPKQSDWSKLAQRPVQDNSVITKSVSDILSDVKKNKDAALERYNLKFDNVVLDTLQVSVAEIERAVSSIDIELKSAIEIAKKNIEKFHRSQSVREPVIETSSGVRCWRKSVAIEKVGLYIPGGTAPLFSTMLMLGIPAVIAGCKQIVVCTPCDSMGEVNATILYVCRLLGIEKIYKVGGAQAIAAMAYGTESIKPVYKIFGPGNQYVTKAKELVQLSGTAIDMPAGPSELLVMADSTGIPEYIASDLLSQAEHGVDSQVILLSDNLEIIEKTNEAITDQLQDLSRRGLAIKALENSKAILLDNMSDCISFSNTYAPEHLIIASDRAMEYSELIVNAGSVFIGHYSCESAGDYASGTNHTLPTNGFARNYSGVSVDSFVKKISFQEITKDGLSLIGNAVEIMASAEGLDAHKNAVSVRLKNIKNV